MKIKNILFIFALALIAIGCQDTEEKSTMFTIGDDVMFSASLGKNGKRTVYGDEASNAFPIYWKNGDKVQIFSPQCLTGRRSAEYQINVEKDGEQNYANTMTKTGAYGVQWGENSTADFYSLYPSGDYTLSSDGKKAENIFINYSQNISVNGNDIKSDMDDCLMYAKTEDFEYAEGAVVPLTYNPISTVFMVTLNVNTESADAFTIQNIKMTAANDANNSITYIAGKFSINVSDGTFAEWGDNKANNVLAEISDKTTGGFHTITQGSSLQIPLFIAPVTGLNTNGWKIEVVTNRGVFTKTLGNQNVVAGKVHKITLPTLSTKTTVTEWDVAKWMTYIPRNVYLSEISIPGSWNSLNSDAQSNTSIEAQYNIGIRGFHIDTRWKRTGSYNNYKYTLGTADGGSTTNVSGQKVMNDSNNPEFATSLSKITSNVKSDEYMVLFCTFAQDSYSFTDSEKRGWKEIISAICDENDVVYDAKSLTENTLVGDVLGKVIVIINTNETIGEDLKNSKCLFTNIPMNATEAEFTGDYNNVAINNGKGQSGIDMYYTQGQITINTDNVDYTGSGDRNSDRGYIPTYGQRKKIADNILNWSKTNYGNENYAHNKWIYLGLGGYLVEWSNGFLGIGAKWAEISNPTSTIATNFNNWINGKVTEMGNKPSGATAVVPYYPVGIVLMNYVNSHATTIKNILTLNQKYRMQNDPEKPNDYNPNAKTKSNYNSTNTNGGDAF